MSEESMTYIPKASGVKLGMENIPGFKTDSPEDPDYFRFKGKKIVFCLPGRSYSGQFLSAWTTLFGNCLQRGIRARLSQMPFGSVTVARLWCLTPDRAKGQFQAPFQGEDYDYIMWIDSDQIFSFNHLAMLLEHDVPIVSGFYALANGQAYSCGKLNQDTRLLEAFGDDHFERAKKDEKGLVEVDWCGFGWTLIKKGTIEKMEYPWFATPEVEIAGIRDLIGEDLYFCRKAEKAGFKTLVDPNCRIGHMKEVII